ncbi:hypothetical protein VN0921_06570 [Helicobacter pylori]
MELEKSLQEIKEAIEKTQEYDQEFEKWIKAGKDLIKGEDFIEVEPEREMTEFVLKYPMRQRQNAC